MSFLLPFVLLHKYIALYTRHTSSLKLCLFFKKDFRRIKDLCGKKRFHRLTLAIVGSFTDLCVMHRQRFYLPVLYVHLEGRKVNWTRLNTYCDWKSLQWLSHTFLVVPDWSHCFIGCTLTKLSETSVDFHVFTDPKSYFFAFELVIDYNNTSELNIV